MELWLVCGSIDVVVNSAMWSVEALSQELMLGKTIQFTSSNVPIGSLRKTVVNEPISVRVKPGNLPQMYSE